MFTVYHSSTLMNSALVPGLLCFWVLNVPVLGVICCVIASIWLASATDYIYTTRWGKFQVWAENLFTRPLHSHLTTARNYLNVSNLLCDLSESL